MIDACDGHPRLGICLDSCHLFAAGYDLADPEAFEVFVSELEAVGFGPSRPDPHQRLPRPARLPPGPPLACGRGVDRPRGLPPAWPPTPYSCEVPLICETPGEAAEDRRNIDLLKGLRDEPGGAARRRRAAGMTDRSRDPQLERTSILDPEELQPRRPDAHLPGPPAQAAAGCSPGDRIGGRRVLLLLPPVRGLRDVRRDRCRRAQPGDRTDDRADGRLGQPGRSWPRVRRATSAAPPRFPANAAMR